MNKEEQQKSFMKYIRFGYHHPSMTKQAEERAALTDMSLVPNQAIPEKDIADQFDIEHSSTQAQAHLKSVKNMSRPLASTPLTSGKAKDIKMKIPITTNKPNIQKYIPIPHSVWPQVREILDQHVERGIIRDGDEPSAFCSSNFSGQEKRWQKYQTSIRWLIAKKLYSKEQRSGRAFSILPLSLNISFKSALHVTFLEQSFPFEMASL